MNYYIVRITFLLICLIPTRANTRAGEGASTEMLPSVSVGMVRTLNRSDPKTYIGTVTGSEAVDIVARISGTLLKVVFEEGAWVKEGDVLFEIEDTVYKANVRAAEALIRQAEANLVLAQKDHERNTELLKERAISTQAWDTTLASQMLQEARIEEAKANLILKQHDLDYCRITSPITGRIGEKMYSEGNYITPSLGVLAKVVQYQPIKVQFPMSESDYFHYFEDFDRPKAAELTIVRANGESYRGATRVAFVDNEVDSSTDTIMITLECDNPANQLLSGGFVQVRVAEKYENPLPSIAISAFMTDGKSHYVFVVDNDDVIERRTVELGDVIDRYQAMKSGLEIGERVVVGGMNKVTPGMKVKPVLSER